jgi:hypothetical protein
LQTHVVTSIRLRHGEPGVGAMLDGWGVPEHDGIWSVGATSRIVVGRLDPGHAHIVELSAHPFINRPFVRFQTIRATIGENVLGEAQIGAPEFVGFRIPPEAVIADNPIVLTLDHPRAARPCDSLVTPDDRWLGVCYDRMRVIRMADVPGWAQVAKPPVAFDAPAPAPPSGGDDEPDAALALAIQDTLALSLKQLVLKFESIGDNCEFGLVQRRCGAEPLGLLRFAATELRWLRHGLDNDFDGLGAPEFVEPELHGERAPREYMIREASHQLVYHTFRYEDEIGSDAIRDQEAKKLRFLRRKFLADLQEGAKILVCKQRSPVTEALMWPLVAELGRRGPNTLLWVAEADEAHPPASVEVLSDRLMKGYMDRFAPGENAHDLSLDCWIRLCANAYAAWPDRKLAEA